MEIDDDNRVSIARFRRLKKAHEYGLVVLSGRQPYWVEPIEGGYVLKVPAECAEGLRDQMEKYQRESINWPPKVSILPEQPSQLWPVFLWAVLLIASHGVSSRWPVLYDLGTADSTLMAKGEIWRAWTALFLHADVSHLAGNVFFGGMFLYFLGRFLGAFPALSWTILIGGIGNCLNAWIYYPNAHYSIGASTAVFTAVGLLSAYPLGYGLRDLWKQGIKSWIAPLIIGAVFLAWFGTGNERTDVTAHLFGFLSGVPFGIFMGFWRSHSIVADQVEQ